MTSQWINIFGGISLAAGIGSCIWIAWDETRHPQKMAVMNAVWPVTALYSGLPGVAAYLWFGRNHKGGSGEGKPSAASVVKGSTHCGAGCTLGDITAEILLALVPSLALLLGWRLLWQEQIFSAWILDFILAFTFGIAFQYFSIKPMHPKMGRGEALRRALQADALSLAAWQVGMYLVMALAHFVVFPDLLGQRLSSDSIAFWWVMQFAMLAGFATAYPVNRWLIARGIKEAM
ncbi:MAG TPA: DUF4396 domain-containing protein [Bradyrhizobium sp.]|nr:DUF4396 domain-containing protein [Bradyrhizobium sp.]